ncbi:TIGR03618 family F420-dependent PPOX class oxidoreductase [Pseudonocardia ailaonensis]|uniref:TIGR03618 family F420-dependent PPOX class oxidoreductase n=1 Tax=Pseudonocardia ailaonensis TaxID=367279 RepID=A0ABN2MWJ2_9PSEU
MPRTIATNTDVDRAELTEFLRPRHKVVLVTFRRDGSPVGSPVTSGVDEQGRIVIATYPERAKSHNVARTGTASVVVLSDEFNGPWVHVDGDAELLTQGGDGADDPAVDALVDYFRSISGEHPDWAEYRQAMVDQGKALIRITPTRWSPVATGGFPARLAES